MHQRDQDLTMAEEVHYVYEEEGEHGIDLCRLPNNVTHVKVAPQVIQFNLVFNARPAKLMSVDFSACTNLRFIGDGSFCNVPNLTSIVLPEKLEILGRQVFARSGLKGTLVIPKSLLEIGVGCFEYCRGLTGINFSGNTQLKICERAFKACDNLVSIDLPNHITTIEDATFDNCRNLKEVSLPCQLQVIDEEAFRHCHMLREIFIPDEVYEISQNAFSECSRLTSVRLPNIEWSFSVDEQAFANCYSIFQIERPPLMDPDTYNWVLLYLREQGTFTLPTANGFVFDSVTKMDENGHRRIPLDSKVSLSPRIYESRLNGLYFHQCKGLNLSLVYDHLRHTIPGIVKARRKERFRSRKKRTRQQAN